MQNETKGILIALVIAVVSPGICHGDLVEVGDLNFIDDPGNPSDGLAFLDMSYSDGLTQAAAIANAQLTFADARLATPSEFDDLFAASGIDYDGALKASDGFNVGLGATISSGSNYDGGALAMALGSTDQTNATFFWTDPDGTNSSSSTREYVFMGTTLGTFAGIYQSNSTPPNSDIGWLLVSDSAAIPEPSAFWCVGLVGLGIAAWKKLKPKFR